jgi:hypothetical protein
VRFAAVILGTTTLLIHRICRDEKIASQSPGTSVQRPHAYLDAYQNSQIPKFLPCFTEKISLFCLLGILLEKGRESAGCG